MPVAAAMVADTAVMAAKEDWEEAAKEGTPSLVSPRE
jgi:hypothetical protein